MFIKYYDRLLHIMRVLDLTTETVKILAPTAAKFCKKYTKQMRRTIKISLHCKKISKQDYTTIAIHLQELESSLAQIFAPKFGYMSRFVKLAQIKKMVLQIHTEFEKAQKIYMVHVNFFT